MAISSQGWHHPQVPLEGVRCSHSSLLLLLPTGSRWRGLREGGGAARRPETGGISHTDHVITQGKADTKRCSSLAASGPLCRCRTDQEEKTISRPWARKEMSSLPLSRPLSFSLPLKIIKDFYFHGTSSILSLERT